MVVKALGQEPLLDLLNAFPDLKSEKGRIVVDRATGATSVAGLFAGGDCLRNGGEVVDAVQDGKNAAHSYPRRARFRFWKVIKLGNHSPPSAVAVRGLFCTSDRLLSTFSIK